MTLFKFFITFAVLIIFVNTTDSSSDIGDINDTKYPLDQKYIKNTKKYGKKSNIEDAIWDQLTQSYSGFGYHKKADAVWDQLRYAHPTSNQEDLKAGKDGEEIYKEKAVWDNLSHGIQQKNLYDRDSHNIKDRDSHDAKVKYSHDVKILTNYAKGKL